MTDSTTIRKAVIAYAPNRWLVRRPCCICGGHTEKRDPMASATMGSENLGNVCDDCATADQDTIRERLIADAEHHERMAQEAREWATFDWSLGVTKQQVREANPEDYPERDEDEPW
jgi:hypothetical protein